MGYGSTASNVTPEMIFSKVSEISIFEYYTRLTVQFDIGFTSPFRQDDEPGCKFWYNGTKIKYIDFADGVNEDCFGLIMIYITHSNFNGAIIRVCEDFRLFGHSSSSPLPKNIDKNRTVKLKEAEKKVIRDGKQDWKAYDIKYWTSYGIHSESLNKFEIVSCKYAFVNDKLRYSYNDKDPCFSYRYADGSRKLYFPTRDSVRFLTNSDYIQGYSQLPQTGEVLIITKSLKDVVVLDILGYPAIAPQSENHQISYDLMEELITRFKYIYILYDNDEAGIKHSNRRVEEYENLIQIFIPEDIAKDISDTSKALIEEKGEEKGLEETKEILEWLLEQ
jgi:hypothetical protein